MASIANEQSVNKTLLGSINARLFHIENAYLVRREIYLHFNASVDSRASKEYLDVINSHKGFFLPLMESALASSTIGLNAIISSKDGESLEKLINKMQQAGEGDFREDLKKLRDKHKKIIKSITSLRMDYFAHFGGLDLNIVEPISDEQYINLFGDLKTLLNKIDAVFGNVVWHMEGDARESIKDTHDLMDSLLRGESQRKSEIDVKLTSELFKIGREKWMKG